jgi:molybdenum cofactor synthesis domain-containing protein
MRVAILTISDGVSEGWREDASGDRIEDWTRERRYDRADRRVIPDEAPVIEATLREWSDEGVADVIVTTGGTGIAARDVTPEATAAALHRRVPGIAEWIRAAGLEKTPYAALSRGLAGIRARTLIVNLPGSPSGVADGLAVLSKVVDHAAELLRGETCHGPEAGES